MKTEGLCFSCVFSSGFERGLKMKLWEDSADSLVLNWTSLKVKYAAIKNTQGGKECGQYSSGHFATDCGGLRTQNLRFFQPETQNYARILRSVPTEQNACK